MGYIYPMIHSVIDSDQSESEQLSYHGLSCIFQPALINRPKTIAADNDCGNIAVEMGCDSRSYSDNAFKCVA